MTVPDRQLPAPRARVAPKTAVISRQSFGIRLLAGAITAFTILLAAALFLNREIEARIYESLTANSTAEAEAWSLNLKRAVPNLSDIIDRGQATPAEVARMEAASSFGNIFRFDLFAPDGTRVIATEMGSTGAPDDHDDDHAHEGEEDHEATARQVFDSGINEIEVSFGDDGDGLPAIYTEAYHRLHLPDGTPFGVVELYVDETQFARILADTHRTLANRLLIGALLIFGLPALAFAVRTWQLRQRDRRLHELSLYDPLTGILNRAAFSDLIQQTFANRGPEAHIGVAFIDIDDFKKVNDSHGHQAGDRLLRQVARALNAGTIAQGGFVGRYGGDEFVVVLPDVAPISFGPVCRDIIDRAASGAGQEDDGAGISLSAGLYLSPPGEVEADAILKADLAHYHVKTSGRGRAHHYYEELSKSRQRRQAIAERLQTALDQNLFTLVFQPIFRPDRTIAGCEALLRLDDADGHPIHPGNFIPIAEANGLITDIGSWTLNAAMKAAASWPAEIWVSINISGHQFASGTLARVVEAATRDSGLPPSRVRLEITESLLLTDEPSVRNQMTTLSAAGYLLSMDDFGAGFSSLGNIQRYAFDTLKLDRSFAVNSENDPDGFESIVGALAALARGIGMDIVVEGIETEDQFAIVTRAGVTLIQGFLLSHPLSPGALVRWLDRTDASSAA